MEDKIGCIGIICTPHHQETLVEWVSEIAHTYQTIVEEDIDVKYACRQMEDAAAQIVVIDEDAGVYDLTTYLPRKKETRFIFISNSQRYVEDEYVRRLAELEQFDILMPRYYVGKKEDFKRQFFDLVFHNLTPDQTKALLNSYPPQRTKGFFRKKLIVEEVEDVLYSEIRSEYDIPESEKQDESEFFREFRKRNNEPVKEEEVLENEVLGQDMEEMMKEMQAGNPENEHHDDAESSEAIEHHSDAIEAELADDDDLERMMKSAEFQAPLDIVEDVKERIEASSVEIQNIDQLDLKNMVKDIVVEVLKDQKLDIFAENRKIAAMSREPQTIIYVSEILEGAGATRFASELASAYANIDSELNVGLFYANDEGDEVLGLLNNFNGEMKPVVHKDVYTAKITNIEEALLSNYNVKIVCLPEIGKLNGLKPVYDDMYVVIGGEPWKVPKFAEPLQNYQSQGLCDNTTFVLGPTASTQAHEFVEEVTKNNKNVGFWAPVKIDPDFFSEESKPRNEWKKLVYKHNSEKLKEIQPDCEVIEVQNKPQLPDKKVKEKKPNVFAEYMAWKKDEWKKPENEELFKWFLGLSAPDAFSVGEENANGVTHPMDFKVVRNKLFQWFPEMREASQNEHHDDAQK